MPTHLMMICRSALACAAYSLSRWAYSTAALTSCTEQGPTMTRRRSSSPLMIFSAPTRPSMTDWAEGSVRGNSSKRISGGSKGRMRLMRASSILARPVCSLAQHEQEKKQVR